MARTMTRLVAAALLLLASFAMPVGADARDWEVVKTERVDLKSACKDNDIEVKTARGVIVVTTGHNVQVKVFTILGQLVKSDTLSAGTHQLIVASHGVYIVKVGDTLTAKVAV